MSQFFDLEITVERRKNENQRDVGERMKERKKGRRGRREKKSHKPSIMGTLAFLAAFIRGVAPLVASGSFSGAPKLTSEATTPVLFMLLANSRGV